MMRRRKGFWSKLLASGETDTVSHKRLVSIISFVCLVTFAFLSAFGRSTDADYIYVFGFLTGGESLLTVIEKGQENRRRRRKYERNEDLEENF